MVRDKRLKPPTKPVASSKTHSTVVVDSNVLLAIADIEALGPNVGWSIGKITNDDDPNYPRGKGVHVTINGTTSAKPARPLTVFQKGTTFTQAAEQAIERYRRSAQAPAQAHGEPKRLMIWSSSRCWCCEAIVSVPIEVPDEQSARSPNHRLNGKNPD